MVASAQSIDLKAGASFATLSNKLPDWKSRTGFAAGVAFDLGSGLIGLQPEVLYVQKGVAFDGTPSGSSDAPRLGYIDVPVLLKITLRTPAIQPMFYAGPSVNFRLSCSFNGADCKDATKSTDYGVGARRGRAPRRQPRVYPGGSLHLGPQGRQRPGCRREERNPDVPGAGRDIAVDGCQRGCRVSRRQPEPPALAASSPLVLYP